MYELFNISGSGMTAHKAWLETTANNITNINTTRTESGTPYQRQIVTFKEKKEFEGILEKEIGKGVEVGSVLTDNTFRLAYEPGHPDSDEEGYVRYPEVDMTAEMTNLLMAQRGYEASATALDTAKKIMQKTLEIGR